MSQTQIDTVGKVSVVVAVLDFHRSEVRVDFPLWFDFTRAVLGFDANASDNS